MLAVDVGCGIVLCWNVGEACRSGSHICGSWYFPRFLLRGVLHADEHCFLDGPRLHVNFLMYNAELVGVHWMSCGGTVEVYGGGGLKMFFNSFPQGSARFSNVRAGEVDVGALVFVDDSCLVGGWIFVFRVAKSCP